VRIISFEIIAFPLAIRPGQSHAWRRKPELNRIAKTQPSALIIDFSKIDSLCAPLGSVVKKNETAPQARREHSEEGAGESF
jgi:hypothetical protein